MPECPIVKMTIRIVKMTIRIVKMTIHTCEEGNRKHYHNDNIACDSAMVII